LVVGNPSFTGNLPPPDIVSGKSKSKNRGPARISGRQDFRIPKKPSTLGFRHFESRASRLAPVIHIRNNFTPFASRTYMSWKGYIHGVASGPARTSTGSPVTAVEHRKFCSRVTCQGVTDGTRRPFARGDRSRRPEPSRPGEGPPLASGHGGRSRAVPRRIRPASSPAPASRLGTAPRRQGRGRPQQHRPHLLHRIAHSGTKTRNRDDA